MLESDVLQPSADQGSDEGDYGESCPEDEELFNLGPDAEVKFMDGMEAHELEHWGIKDLHQFLGHLPVQTAKESQGTTHTEAAKGSFLPLMDEEEHKWSTPSELLLYKHALEYRYMWTWKVTSTYMYILSTKF